MTDRIVVAGASRGIGAAVAGHYAGQGSEVISLSRTPPADGRWLKCDLSQTSEIARVADEIGPQPLRALLFTGGIWERGAFTGEYRFEASPPEEAAAVLAVNLLAPILLVQALLPALEAGRGRVVLIGSLDGRDHSAGREVANSASKYGLRGAAQALHPTLRARGIGLTVLNPDNVATPEVEADIAEGRFPPQVAIPMADILAVIDFALALSPATVATEIDLAQMRP